MRTTITLDDDLLADAREFSGIEKVSDLVNEALRSLIAWEASRQLAKLGGSDPEAWVPERSRPEQ
ncbi:MAG: type II toxin-antitoxin system VapB family antitoxin [Pacificimonas sp.]